MNVIKILLCCVFCFLGTSSNLLSHELENISIPYSNLQELVASTSLEGSVESCVVLLETEYSRGSGVFINTNGVLITNYHVIEDAESLTIYSGGKSYTDIKIIGVFQEADIVVLQIQNIKSSAIGVSLDYKTGDPIYSLGFSNRLLEPKKYGTILSHDFDSINVSTHLNHGNSGGGIFNAKDELIGIIFAYGNNQNLAVPVSKLLDIGLDISIPFKSFINFEYNPNSVQNFNAIKSDDLYSLSWSPIYNADYYKLYYTDDLNKEFKLLLNPNTSFGGWYWASGGALQFNFPHDRLYLKITAIVDDLETENSSILLLSRYTN